MTTRLPTLFLLLMSLSGGLASSAAAQASHGSDRGAGVRSPSVMLMLMNACNEGHKFREKQRKRRTRDGTIHNVLNQDSIKNALNFLFI